MPAPITLYAIEHDPRDYDLTSFKLSSGLQYEGILLYNSLAEAQISIDSDIAAAKERRDEDGLDEDDDDYQPDEEIENDAGSVAPVTIHHDGSIFDAAGFDISSDIGNRFDKQPSDVKADVAELFTDVSKGLKKQRNHEVDGPQF